MKKLLALLLLSPLANADMDKICSIVLIDEKPFSSEFYIEAFNCERNNILQINYYIKEQNRTMPLRQLLLLESNKWCRFDRNRSIEGYVLSCVLYSDKPRILTGKMQDYEMEEDD